MALDFKRLRTAAESSIQQIESPRKNRNNAIRQYVGKHYAGNGAENRVPVNMLELAVTIYTRQLAARAPQAMIGTTVPGLRPYARNMELALNQIPDEINLGRTFRRAVMEAIFGIGIVKVGIHSSGQVVMGHEYGESFVDVITFDDYFLDMTAKKLEAIQFEGNDYWLPLKVARDMAGDDKLEADDYTTTGDSGEERAESVSADDGTETYSDRIWTRDIWLPDTGRLVTYGVKSKKQFKAVDWDGPKAGPYRKLGYSDVPGNLLPLAPVALMIDLHELANALFRKLGRQADAKKTVAAFPGGQDEDVANLKMAQDGDGINYHGRKPEPITVGGIDQATLAMFLQTRDLFSYFAGNLDTLGGLAPMTETVGQEGMLSEAAGARITFMKRQTVDFAKGVFGDLAWYEWTDPVRRRVIEKPINGTDIVLRRVWSQETRDGDFLDYNFDIDAYSMQDDTPVIRLQKIGQVFDRYILPLLPMIQQQGGQIDTRKLLALVGKLANLPELETLIQYGEPMGDQQQPHGNSQPTLQSPHTTRTYERVNRPGATRHGKDDVLTRLLMGSGAQDSEIAGLGRSAS